MYTTSGKKTGKLSIRRSGMRSVSLYHGGDSSSDTDSMLEGPLLSSAPETTASVPPISADGSMSRCGAAVSFAIGGTTGSLCLAYLWHATEQSAEHPKKGLPVCLMMAPLLIPFVLMYAVKDRQRFNMGAVVGVCLTWVFTDVLFEEENLAMVAAPLLMFVLVKELTDSCLRTIEDDEWLELEDEDEEGQYVFMGGYRNGLYTV